MAFMKSSVYPRYNLRNVFIKKNINISKAFDYFKSFHPNIGKIYTDILDEFILFIRDDLNISCYNHSSGMVKIDNQNCIILLNNKKCCNENIDLEGISKLVISNYRNTNISTVDTQLYDGSFLYNIGNDSLIPNSIKSEIVGITMNILSLIIYNSYEDVYKGLRDFSL